MDTDQLKIIIDAMQSLGAEAKTAFIVYIIVQASFWNWIGACILFPLVARMITRGIVCGINASKPEPPDPRIALMEKSHTYWLRTEGDESLRWRKEYERLRDELLQKVR